MTTTDTQLQAASLVAQVDGDAESDVPFRLRRVLRLSSFQIGSAMGDILVTSVWNRIMISNYGIPAWPVGALIALRYLLAPLSLWAGYRSDTKPLWGFHRTPYIWAGRFMMVISFPVLGLSLARLGNDTANPLGWLLSILSFLLYGVGVLISGSPYLTLVRDSVPKEKQGLAVSAVEITLIAFFPITAIAFGYWLEDFSLPVFWQVLLFTMLVAGFFWGFAIAGVEKRGRLPAAQTRKRIQVGFRRTFGKIWRDRRTRRFFLFLALGTVAAWTQDNILEPFGAEVFNLGVGQTTRFNAYWQGMTVVVLILATIFQRKRRPEQQTTLTKIGLGIMALGIAVLALSSIGEQFRLVRPGLLIFGAGFGLYTFGAFSLMMVMTTDKEAGVYLGLWSACILVSRGLGIGLGSIFRDLILSLTASANVTYAAIFLLEAAGLALAAGLLSRTAILSFARDSGRLDGGEELVKAIDL